MRPDCEIQAHFLLPALSAIVCIDRQIGWEGWWLEWDGREQKVGGGDVRAEALS